MEREEESKPADFSGKQLAIIYAAEALMARQGFEGTSVRDIAQAAGVNLAMINYYFGSKDKLLEAIIAHRIAGGAMMLEDLLHDASLDPLEKMKTLVDRYVDRMMEFPHYHKIIIREQLAGTSVASAIHSTMEQAKLRNMKLVKTIISEGLRKKIFTKSVDVPLMMSTIFGTFYQVLSNTTLHRHAWGMEELSDETFQTKLRAKLKTHLRQILIAALTHEA